MLLARYAGKGLEAGCDEAGRGCLAGPVFAAAVVLPYNFFHPELNDSKKMNATTRLKLKEIIEQKALYWSVAHVGSGEIDRINILNASFKAMHLALDQLGVIPDRLLIDGNRFNPYASIPHHCIVQGDSKYASIAAASILAKTYRDEYMCQKSNQYTQYGWRTNMGYPTVEHRTAIAKHGPTPLHRKSFKWHPDI